MFMFRWTIPAMCQIVKMSQIRICIRVASSVAIFKSKLKTYLTYLYFLCVNAVFSYSIVNHIGHLVNSAI